MRIVSRRVVARTTRMERIMLDALASAIGRFPKTVPMLAAHAPATKSVVPPSETFPSYRGLFIGFLVGVVLIVGGLAFFPALALCSVAGHLALRGGLFIGFLVGVVLIVGGLAFAPAFAVGPLAGNMAMPASALS
jgi:K+-transporting ATPase A subunit